MVFVAEPTKVRHHYVPAFILEGFVDPDNEPYLWICDKEGGEQRPASPRDAGLEKHFHSFTTTEGTRDTTSVEEALAAVENHVAPVWRKVIAQQSITDSERGDLAGFLSILMTRVPAYRHNIERMTAEMVRLSRDVWVSHSHFEDWVVDDFTKRHGQAPTANQVAEVRRIVLGSEVMINPAFSLTAISDQFARVFYAMNWAFVIAEGRYRFVTGDNPVFYMDPTHDPKSFYGVGLVSNENVEVTCPMSRDVALVAGWRRLGDGASYVKGTERIIRQVNLHTILAASRFVYSSQRSDGLTRWVQKYKGSGPTIKFG